MDNKVIFAAAGNGKTYSICKQAKDIVDSTKGCVLLISYTNEGIRSLEKEYKKQNSGVLDERVIIKSWYSFLLSDFIKPYQCFLNLKYKRYKKDLDCKIPENHVSSIAFYSEDPPRYYGQTHIQYYLNSAGDVYPNRTSEFAFLCNEHSKGKTIARIENIYTNIYIDELQDYAGWDLELIKLLFASKIRVTCVGDYKQATYRTNNSLKNKQYRDEKIREFFSLLEKKGLCSLFYDNTTRRFNQEICEFINTVFDDTESLVEENTDTAMHNEDNTGVYILDSNNMAKYCELYNPVVLRYDKKAKIEFEHNCTVLNYGASKGSTYERTVIIPVSTVMPFLINQKEITSNQTRSKFYVACTRARHSVVFVVNGFKETAHFKPISIKIGENEISGFKYKSTT